VEFDEFAREQLPGLVRFAAALTGDRALAQDLVQDALMRAYLKWARVAAAARPDLYLRRMVVNGHLTWRRRWYQRSVRPVGEPTTVEPVADPTGRIADRAELTDLLGRLSRQQRAAIVLRYFEDLSDEEIGTVLGCTAGAVRGYVSRGLAALRGLAGPAHPTTEVPTR
jgi:RNA polymerase sigma-70 factor (sigma-E family)